MKGVTVDVLLKEFVEKINGVLIGKN